MRQSLLFARGLTFAAALVLASPLASAAPARRAKPKTKHLAPAATDRAPTAPDATDRASGNAAGEPAQSEDDALVKSEQKASPSASETKAPLAPLAPDASPAADSEASNNDEGSTAADQRALGRREAARIAAGRSEVGVSVSAEVGNRRFKYSDELGSLLRPYKLSIAPDGELGLEAYPLATSDVPVLRDLGFRGRFSRAFGLDSTTPDGDKIETSWTRYSGEVRERLLVPARHPLEFGAFFGADASYFVMSGNSR